ncbi:MAG: VanZ family protein [Lachnospiraceae bacterium]
MDIPIYDRIFSLFSEARQREKLMVMLRQYFFENPVAIAAVVLAGIVLIVSLFTNHMSEKGKRRADWACLFGYFVALVLLLVFSRYWQGDIRGLRLFEIGYFVTSDGFHETNVLITFVNALVFIPFGCLLRKAAVSWRPGLQKSYGGAAWLAGALLRLVLVLVAGVAIEVLQYVFARGNSSLLDVAAYFAGSILGMLLMGFWLLLTGRLQNVKTGGGKS